MRMEGVLHESNFVCNTGHTLDIQVDYGVENDVEGFLFTVEDDNFKTYRKFIALETALRIHPVGLPLTNEKRRQVASKVLTSLRLENSRTDGRKLSILFEARVENIASKPRSPAAKPLTRDEVRELPFRRNTSWDPPTSHPSMAPETSSCCPPYPPR